MGHSWFSLVYWGVAGTRACLDCVPAIHYRGSCKHFSLSWGWASPPKGSVSAPQGSRWDGAAPAPPGPRQPPARRQPQHSPGPGAAAVPVTAGPAAPDGRAGTGLGWLGTGTPSLQGVQLLSMNILGGGWPEVRKGRWVGEIKWKDNVDTEQMMLNGLWK